MIQYRAAARLGCHREHGLSSCRCCDDFNHDAACLGRAAWLVLRRRGVRGVKVAFGGIAAFALIIVSAASAVGIWYSMQPHALNRNGREPLLRRFEAEAARDRTSCGAPSSASATRRRITPPFSLLLQFPPCRWFRTKFSARKARRSRAGRSFFGLDPANQVRRNGRPA